LRDLDLVFGTLVLKYLKMVSIWSQHTLFGGIIGVVSERNYVYLCNIEIDLEKGKGIPCRPYTKGQSRRATIQGNQSNLRGAARERFGPTTVPSVSK
jgi:hypothetical protein